jgi:hypothetical protein
MAKDPPYTYDVYIGAPVEKVWKGLIDGEMTKHYVGQDSSYSLSGRFVPAHTKLFSLGGQYLREAVEAGFPPGSGHRAGQRSGKAGVPNRNSRSGVDLLQMISYLHRATGSPTGIQVCASFRGGSTSINAPSRA